MVLVPRRAPRQTIRAREQRKDNTVSEGLLWAELKAKQLGVRFRRQEPIGPYIVDFACRTRRLVIELDGAGHWSNAAAAHDAERDAWLEAHGWRVFRIPDLYVYQQLDHAVEMIRDILENPHVLDFYNSG
jgi:very-short-patch-repair endonuclease